MGNSQGFSGGFNLGAPQRGGFMSPLKGAVHTSIRLPAESAQVLALHLNITT